MYSIGIDTSHLFLLLVLMDDNSVIDFVKMDCLKQQSEFIVTKMDELVNRNNLTIEQIDNIVVTVGPGSYTGVRIGMTVAKILGSIVGKNVYTLSTLQLYAGNIDCYSIIDARAKRVYVGRYQNGIALESDAVLPNEVMQQIIDKNEVEIIGDLHVFGKEDNYGSLENNFMILKDKWCKVENIDILSPTYLKEKEEYLKV